MTTLRLVALATLCLASAPNLASGQCVDQTLTANVPDQAAFGNTLSQSGSELLVGTWAGGAAFLFENTGAGWVQTFRFRSPDPQQAGRFGARAVIDGDTVAVSDPQHATGGKVYVFVRAGSGWQLQAELAASDAAPGDFFGNALDLAGDLVAAGGILNTGSAYIFERTGTQWTERERLTRPFNFFGYAVAIAGDTVFVGASGDADQQFNSGACYVFERVGSSWGEADKLFPSNPFSDALFANALDYENGRLAIGAPAYFNPNRRGLGYIFENVGGQWVETQRLRMRGSAPNTPGGGAIAIRGDRVVLASFGDASEGRPGGAWVFENNGSEWAQNAVLRQPGTDGSYNEFASAVALVGDQVLLGSRVEGPAEEGVVHAFDLTQGLPTKYCQTSVNSTGQAASIAAIGSQEVGADDVILLASDVPAGVGFFLIGAQTAQVPLWDGFLCLAAPFERFDMINSNNGELIQNLDLGTVNASVTAGSTWNFQAWFSDAAAGATGGNLTDGVTITFCP